MRSSSTPRNGLVAERICSSGRNRRPVTTEDGVTFGWSLQTTDRRPALIRGVSLDRTTRTTPQQHHPVALMSTCREYNSRHHADLVSNSEDTLMPVGLRRFLFLLVMRQLDGAHCNEHWGSSWRILKLLSRISLEDKRVSFRRPL